MKSRYILLAMIALPVTISGLNYSGMCIPEGRWLSDEERLDIEVRKLLNNEREWIPAGPDSDDRDRYYAAKPYLSKKELFDVNPDCCSVSRYTDKKTPYIIFQRITGADSGKHVVTRYLQRYYFNGTYYESPIIDLSSRHLQSNCGHYNNRNKVSN